MGSLSHPYPSSCALPALAADPVQAHFLKQVLQHKPRVKSRPDGNQCHQRDGLGPLVDFPSRPPLPVRPETPPITALVSAASPAGNTAVQTSAAAAEPPFTRAGARRRKGLSSNRLLAPARPTEQRPGPRPGPALHGTNGTRAGRQGPRPRPRDTTPSPPSPSRPCQSARSGLGPGRQEPRSAGRGGAAVREQVRGSVSPASHGAAASPAGVGVPVRVPLQHEGSCGSGCRTRPAESGPGQAESPLPPSRDGGGAGPRGAPRGPRAPPPGGPLPPRTPRAPCGGWRCCGEGRRAAAHNPCSLSRATAPPPAPACAIQGANQLCLVVRSAPSSRHPEPR